MGNFWEDLGSGFQGRTKYERGEEKRKARRDAEAKARQEQRNKQASSILGSDDPTGNILSGSEKEQKGQLAGLNTAKMVYKQGLQQTGQDIQGIKKDLQGRLAQGAADPVSAAIMGQKASAQANAQRQLGASGAKGAAAAGALESVGRQQDQNIASSLYGQQRQSLNDYRSLIGNILSGTTGLMYGEKAANTQQPFMPNNSGSSFICTMLRSKKLMNSKEAFIMTKFMLKSMVQRADFLVWYFKHGKKAVDNAESQGFDWSSIKYLFVDDIIALLKEGKFREAQDLYILRTGTFCSEYGAEEFDYKLTNYRPLAMFNFPKLLLIKPCIQWLKANFKSIPKILTAKIAY